MRELLVKQKLILLLRLREPMLFLTIAELQHITKNSQPEAGSVSPAIQTNQTLLSPTDDWEEESEAWGLWQVWIAPHIWNRT